MTPIDRIIKIIREDLDHGDYWGDKLEDIKDLLKTSRDVILFGRDESIKAKLIKDISECLGDG